MSNSSVSEKSKTDTIKRNQDFHMLAMQIPTCLTSSRQLMVLMTDFYFLSKGLAEDQLKIGRWNSLHIALGFLEDFEVHFVSTYLPTQFQASRCRSLRRRGPVDTHSFHDQYHYHVDDHKALHKSDSNQLT